MVKIMAVNAGSSSLKFQLLDMPSEHVITTGVIERIGQEMSHFEIMVDGSKVKKDIVIKTHEDATKLVVDALLKYKIVSNLDAIQGVGHRVVHGGETFKDSMEYSEQVIQEIEGLCELAPLHNPANLTGYYAFSNALTNAKHVFVFDTAFHQTIDEERYLYALPYEYYTDLKVRKYGAHGTSHKYVSNEVIQYLGNPKKSKIIVCHLGNGASLSAVLNGQCIDTTMGFTPLAGLMMGTRCGDVDPSIMPYLCDKLNKTPQEVLEVYNKKSGMLGVSGISSDSRDIEHAIFKEGSDRALTTALLYARTVSKYIGSYVMELGGVDAIAFTAGLGENASYMRNLIISNIKEALGIEVDIIANKERSSGIKLISTSESKVKMLVVPTNEEVMIARDTVRILKI